MADYPNLGDRVRVQADYDDEPFEAVVRSHFGFPEDGLDNNGFVFVLDDGSDRWIAHSEIRELTVIKRQDS